MKDGLKMTKSDVVTRNPIPVDISNLNSKEIIDKFNKLIEKKKEKYYASNLKPHDFREMCQQVQVISISPKKSENKIKQLIMGFKDTPVGGYVIDSKHFDQLTSFDDQLKYQSELLCCFYNQQPDIEQMKDISPATTRVKIETKSMTNLTADDEYNPFLTYLKTKTNLIHPNKVSKRQALEIWADYKRAVNKVLPSLRSQLESRKCNIKILISLLSSYVASKGGTLQTIMGFMEEAVEFAVRYMEIYYHVEALAKQRVDLREIFRFGAFQILFKDEGVNSKINNAAHNESFGPSKAIPRKFSEIIAALKQIPSIKKYLDKTDSQEKAEKLAIMKEKKSNLFLT